MKDATTLAITRIVASVPKIHGALRRLRGGGSGHGSGAAGTGPAGDADSAEGGAGAGGVGGVQAPEPEGSSSFTSARRLRVPMRAPAPRGASTRPKDCHASGSVRPRP